MRQSLLALPQYCWFQGSALLKGTSNGQSSDHGELVPSDHMELHGPMILSGGQAVFAFSLEEGHGSVLGS